MASTIVRNSSAGGALVRRRFDALRELIPHRDKLDKASFLFQTVEYIGQLQVLLPMSQTSISSTLRAALNVTCS